MTTDTTRHDSVGATMAGYVDRGEVVGLSWAVVRDGEVSMGAVGTLEIDGDGPVELDTIFRISSVTKPITGVATMMLVDDGRLGLDDAVDEWLPELADRRVLASPAAALDDTVRVTRPISVRDLLTFRMGLGMDFANFGNQPVLEALADAGLPVGPPAPQQAPDPDEFMRLLGSVPLEHQPGERWLYNTGAQVLGVLVSRVSGRSFGEFLSDRLFGPLSMNDTGFSVPEGNIDRFGPCYGTNPETGERGVYDPADGQWSVAPRFDGGDAGLVSTVGDLVAFGRLLAAGGIHEGQRLLSTTSIDAMTSNQLTTEQLRQGGAGGEGAVGWGLGMGVRVTAEDGGRSVGTYGWDGGMGSTWHNDPARDVIGVLLTNEMWNSPVPPAVCDDFWRSVYAAGS